MAPPTPLPSIAPYAASHVSPSGPGDARPTALKVVEDQHLSDALRHKTILLTGFSTGIGLATARALAATGARLVLLAKDTSAHPKVPLELASIAGPGTPAPLVVEMDLADLASVAAAATVVRNQCSRLDIAILNAGVMTRNPSKTPQGHDLTFGINFIGHFALLHALVPLLVDHPTGARIVTLSSLGHLHSGPIDIPWITGGHATREPDHMFAYHQSKLATLYLATEADRRLRRRGVRAFAVSPGSTLTALCDALPTEVASIFDSSRPAPFTKSNEQGAATVVWAALARELEGLGGLYLEDEAVAQPAATPAEGKGFADYAYDADAARELWEVSCDIVGVARDE
ncbi:short-chain dehydrogenase [Zopfochytrium polystomum]|nr:short-chain dehydrogenase [Zopfochytrium polystomum]